MKAHDRSAFWQRAIPGALVSLIAILALSQMASWEGVGSALRALEIWRVLAACGLFLLSLVWRALGWRILLGGQVTFRRVFLSMNAGYLLNNLFPFRLGEFGRAVLMGEHTGKGALHTLSTIAIERIFDLTITAALVLVSLPLVINAAWAQSAAVLMFSLSVLGLLILYIAARTTARWLPALERVLNRSPRLQTLILPRLRSILAGFEVLTNPMQFALALLLIALSWGTVIFEHLVLLNGFDSRVQFVWATFGLGVAGLGVAIPSAPGALGVMEASVVAALAVFNVAREPALAFAILLRLIYFVFTLIFGLYALASEGETLTDLYRRALNMQ
ncbi:MAG: hypothetical protein OHK0052_19920 [Anaerolineales bacterium]